MWGVGAGEVPAFESMGAVRRARRLTEATQSLSYTEDVVSVWLRGAGLSVKPLMWPLVGRLCFNTRRKGLMTPALDSRGAVIEQTECQPQWPWGLMLLKQWIAAICVSREMGRNRVPTSLTAP